MNYSASVSTVLSLLPLLPCRPVAGFINICPTALQASLIRDLRATVKHEVLHAIVSCVMWSGTHLRALVQLQSVH